MRNVVLLGGLCLAFSLVSVAQMEQLPSSDKGPGPSQAVPRSSTSRASDESSSRDTHIDLSPPRDDAKNHPFSGASLSDAEDEASGGVQEFHSWDPHKAAKDIEVGDFYFKRKNYRAALSRYKEALQWKDNDAVAHFRLAQCFEKVNDPEQATAHYQAYLKILPHGEFAEESQKALDKLKPATEKSQARQ
jgi:tetratricopeptide (TPR) repeat protein